MAESNFGSYVFEVESTQNPNFTVSSINGNERLGEPYCFDVDVVSTIVGLNLAELMGKVGVLGRFNLKDVRAKIRFRHSLSHVNLFALHRNKFIP
jgi:hypothetical protein